MKDLSGILCFVSRFQTIWAFQLIHRNATNTATLQMLAQIKQYQATGAD
jgi:hypothetical protein